MSPAPIHQSTIQVILQYISPPSQLDRPLPPYLLSKSLLQRYHFLGVSPENPQEYLCWPIPSSENCSKAIELLENLPRSDHEDCPLNYNVRYTADDEYTYAHVNPVTSGDDGLRLVFQWDGEDGWKYHDTRIMPFPPGSQPSPSAAVPVAIPIDTLHDIPSLHEPQAESSDDDDGDDYWNAYGSQDSEVYPTGAIATSKDTANSDDAYWALYSTVHGSADSTRPSPPPLPYRKPYQLEDVGIDPDSPHPLPVPVRIVSEDTIEDALPIPSGAIIKPNTSFPWDPASPRALTHLLSSISPRPSYGDPTLDLVSDTETENEPDLLSPSAESIGSVRTSSSIGLGLIGDLSQADAQSNASYSDAVQSSIGTVDDGLRDGIRGLYSLWKASRRCENDGPSSLESDREAFMRIVEEIAI